MTLFRSQQQTNNEIFGRINSKLEANDSHHEFLLREIEKVKEQNAELQTLTKGLVFLIEKLTGEPIEQIKEKPKKGNKKDRLIDEQK
jgi:hypothetical protein